MKTLRLILGDQLSHSISSLQGINSAEDLVLMCEVRTEATYVKHHKKKIVLLFSAMRHFAAELKAQGYQVRYTYYDDPANGGSFTAEVERLLTQQKFDKIVVTYPGEYRVLQELQSWQVRFNLPVEIREDNRFLSTPHDFATWAAGRKQLRMEFFYREMRKRYAILMAGNEPVGGQWNYDAENRKPPKSGLTVPTEFKVEPDDITQQVMVLVGREFKDHFGDLAPFHFAVTRAEALKALESFIQERLPTFGDYQDAMVENEPWMFHAHIAFYLNCGLLLPLECIQAAEQAYQNNQVPLNAAEGFIRQIMGWREYVRGIYWLKMPGYDQLNYFEHQRPLPAFYWTAETSMNCLKQCVNETKQNAYAHHIQRLMILGNFALLAGINPVEVNEWFLVVYADAYEWVELPNVTGMALFADGGQLASKPYAASGAYINKMSNYCQNCKYKVAQKNGPEACPFNYLYWDFLNRNRDKLKNNPRLGMIYRSYDKMDAQKKVQIKIDSQAFLDQLT